jgi:hypothetical protein
VLKAATSGVGGGSGRGCPRWWQIWRASYWERESVCGHVGPGTGEACGLSPLTSVGPPPVDGSYLNFCRLLWPIEVKIISVGWLWQ